MLIVGSTRADDIVRDADILHLYRKAGVIRWLLGMENTDEQTLAVDPQGRQHLIRSRGDKAAAQARHIVDGDLGGRLRG